ncbi:hypothetical protein CGZ92_12750 [Parenemella sanctibonifatiensis]|uniref:Uncharacterized protein n=1 Tax=Parenemella sanctibonifatiensis TaxID=2016505 RepID=A0A255DZE7_9ACTN|nr:hypothetical protein CGZ92_12750 [Parenemella sanctibonifatiensis]
MLALIGGAVWFFGFRDGDDQADPPPTTAQTTDSDPTGGTETTSSAPTSSGPTSSPTSSGPTSSPTSSAPTSSGDKASLQELEDGMTKIFAAPEVLGSEELGRKLAACVAPKIYDEVSDETVNNLAAGRDLMKQSEVPFVTEQIQSCSSEIA